MLMLCLSTQTTLAVVVPRSENAFDSKCAVCEMLVGIAERYLENNATEEFIQTELNKICNLLPGIYGDDCHVLVNGYLKDIIDSIINKESPEEICSEIGECSSKNVAKGQSIECPICVSIVSHAEYLLQRNSTLQEIEDVLGEMCRVLVEKDWESTCDSFVDNYTPIIIQLLIGEFNPTAVCQELKLCKCPTGNQVMVVPNDKKSQVMVVPQKQTRRPVVDPATKSNDYCGMCESVAAYLISQTPNATTVEKLIQQAENYCQLLQDPSIISACQQTIKDYGEIIVKFIQNEPNADQVCSYIGLCQSVSVRFRKTW